MIRPNSSHGRMIAVLITASLANLSVPLGISGLFGTTAASTKERQADKPDTPKSAYGDFAGGGSRGGETSVRPAPTAEQTGSRPLSLKELRTAQGKVSVSPYIAGSGKWSVFYKGVDLLTGNFTTSGTDITFEGGYGIPVNVTRSYSANNPNEGPLGVGWSISTDIRTTAGGLLKSSSAPVRSVPMGFRERPSSEAVDPNISTGSSTQPASAVLSEDASGKVETIQRDVDGVLTPPAWDTNIVDSVYEYVTMDSTVYQVLVQNTVKTIDGTTYVYEKKGSYEDGVHEMGVPTGPAEPSNILKITSATDRQGNVTTYTYSGSGSTIHFATLNGQTTEQKLTQVEMPNGHKLIFTWGDGSNAPTNRIRTVSADTTSSSPRVVTYCYTSGYLTSVTSPAGLKTMFGYGGADASNSNTGGACEINASSISLLTGITDPRGLVTAIHYVVGKTYAAPYGFAVYAPVVYKISAPNGAYTWFNFYGTTGSGSPSAISGSDTVRFCDLDTSSNVVNLGKMSNSFSSGIFHVGMEDGFAPEDLGVARTVWGKDYAVDTQNLVSEIHYSHKRSDPDDPVVARFSPDTTRADRTVVETSYNFMGNPLVKLMKEQVWYGSSSPSYRSSREITTETCYWGRDKYYQQKATKTGATYFPTPGSSTGAVSLSAPRYSYTDYFDSSATAGKRGQTYRVWDPKYGDISIDSGISLPSWVTDSSKYWRYRVVPGSGKHAAEFDYDSKGRPIDVWKLQGVSGGTYSRVQTHTTYGSDGSPSWGQASTVVEDYGSGKLNRTTQTLSYDSSGRATKVEDASGRQFETTYDGDGKVLTVTRPDLAYNPNVVTYTYGTSGVAKGMPVTVRDSYYDQEQYFTYASSGAGIGQLASMEEDDNYATYTTTYGYNANGERLSALYSTPNGDTLWKYYDYVHVGTPESPQRVFQTLQKCNASTGNPTDEEMHYAYDLSGRLRRAAFAQTAHNSSAASTGRGYDSYYTSGVDARAITAYDYDAGGRMLDTESHWWWKSGASEYEEYVLGNHCGYATPLGLKEASEFRVKHASASTSYDVQRNEAYAYDADLDYLTSWSNTPYGSSTTTRTWSYDAAGNRSSDSGNSGTWTYDNLNRMSASPGMAYTNDILGNRLTRNISSSNSSAQRLEWDWSNRVKDACGVSGGARFEYRADGMRTLKIEGLTIAWSYYEEDDKHEKGSGFYDDVWSWNQPTTRYYYDGQMGFEDDYAYQTGSYGSSTSHLDVTRYGLGARGIDRIAKTTSVGEGSEATVVQYPLYDAHGNMVATLSKGSGTAYTVSNQRAFEPWGSVFDSSGLSGTPKQGYCASIGHVADSENGLTYMRARYYEPSTGRFISEDPAREGQNWFDYCHNDPLNLLDGSGKLPAWLITSITISVLGLLAKFSIGSPPAAMVAMAGVVMLSAWFGTTYLTGFDTSQPFGVMVGFLFEHAVADLHAHGEQHGYDDIPTQATKTVANYMLVLGLFMFLSNALDD